MEDLLAAPYVDTDVRVRGRVLEADVRAGRFLLFPDGGRPIRVEFNEAQEGEVVQALRDHRSRELFVRGRGQFHADGRLKQIMCVAELRLEDLGGPEQPTGASIADQLLELAREVPEEAFEGVPSDASSKLDEYLYGELSG